MRGFASATSVNLLANRSRCSPKPLTILYIGDYDPSGMYMSDVDLPDRLNKYGAHNFSVERISLYWSDLKMLGTACFSAHDKTTDPRYRWFVPNCGEVCAELDALSPNTLRERLRLEIEKRIDFDLWRESRRVEAQELERLGKVIATWDGG